MLTCVFILLLTSCNRDDEPLDVYYFSTIAFLANDTTFTAQSIKSRDLYNSLHAQIAEISRAYSRDTVVFTTWGKRKNTYHTSDSIEIERLDATVAELNEIKKTFDTEKIEIARDGSFIIRVSVFVARDKKLDESRSINYIFNCFEQ